MLLQCPSQVMQQQQTRGSSRTRQVSISTLASYKSYVSIKVSRFRGGYYTYHLLRQATQHLCTYCTPLLALQVLPVSPPLAQSQFKSPVTQCRSHHSKHSACCTVICWLWQSYEVHTQSAVFLYHEMWYM